MRTERAYASEASNIIAARRFVTEVIGEAPRPFVFDVQLMTSELVTNAILHAASEFTLSVEVREQLITISVTDNGDNSPVVQQPVLSDTSGRGLVIVEALSRQWGVTPRTPLPGKTVWFTVEPPGPDALG